MACYDKISITIHDIDTGEICRVYTPQEFADSVGVSLQCLNRLHRANQFKSKFIKCDKNGRTYRYYTEDMRDVFVHSSLYLNLNCIKNRDILHTRIGKLKVLDFSESAVRKGYYGSYVCKCDCGTIVELARSELLSGKYVSCGCKFHDLTGKDFDRWHVDGMAPCSYTPGGSKIFRYYCTCQCGTKRVVIARGLTSGASKSCGCLHKEMLSDLFLDDLTNRDFGELHVDSRAPSRVSPSGKSIKTMWNCTCKCGRKIVVSSDNLKLGYADSCGQCNTDEIRGASMYEFNVILYLESIGLFDGEIDGYCQYKSYPDLIGEGGGYLLYDFYIPSYNGHEWLIECQGEQHYKSVKWYGGEDAFRRRQEHDRRKREYAVTHNIAFVEIPYTCVGYENISELLKKYGLM